MEIKQQILQGAAEMFMRYGIKSITMDDLSRHLSMSKKTIYQYYEDKDALVLEIVNMHQNQQRCDMEQIFTSTHDVIEEFIKASEYLKIMTSQMNPSLLFDLRKYHPLAWKAFQDHKRVYIVEMITRTLQKGVDQGMFRNDFNIEILAKMRVEQIELAFNLDIYPVGKYELSEVHHQLFEHFIYGICTVEGHKRLDELKQQRKEQLKTNQNQNLY